MFVNFTKASTAALIAIVIGAAQAPAATVADQSFNPIFTGQNSVSVEQFFGQTVTAGVTGRLSAIEVLIATAVGGTSSNLTLSLHGLDAIGAPDLSQSGGAVSIARTALPQIQEGVVRFELDALGFNVTAGTPFGFVLRVPEAVCCSLLMTDDGYDGGFAWIDPFGGDGFDNTWDVNRPERTVDLWFNTFVDPSPIPLPAGGLLFVSALAGLFGVRRWRRNGAAS